MAIILFAIVILMAYLLQDWELGYMHNLMEVLFLELKAEIKDFKIMRKLSLKEV